MARHPTHQALILDFDGTIIDTEWPGYAAFQRLHDELGLPPIPLVRWQSTIGLADDAVPIDFFAGLMSQLPDADPAEVTNKRRRYRDEYVAAEQVRPGIIEWVNHARDLGLPVGVASSSSPGWVVGHLERLSLLHLFDHIEGADLVITGEGHLDAQSFEGKVVGGVAEIARELGVPRSTLYEKGIAHLRKIFEDCGLREYLGEARHPGKGPGK